MTSLSVIVPAYNEEELIGGVIRDIQRWKDRYDLEVIMVEGGSKDRTADVARAEGARVIQFPKKRGKGADFWSAALEAKGEFIIQVDADHQFQPSQIPQMMDLFTHGADVVLGSRFLPEASCEAGSVHWLNRAGNWGLSLAVTCMIGKRITDTMAGYKGLHRRVLPFLQLRVPHFGYEAELVIRAHRAGFLIAEMPVIYKARGRGVSTVRRFKDGFRVLASILQARFTPLQTQTAKRCPACTGVAIEDQSNSAASKRTLCLRCGHVFMVD